MHIFDTLAIYIYIYISYMAVSLANRRVEDEVRRSDDVHQGHRLVFELETHGEAERRL